MLLTAFDFITVTFQQNFGILSADNSGQEKSLNQYSSLGTHAIY